VTPTATPTIDRIGKALENLALAVLNDTTILQQLTAANLALTALITSLTMANKKLAEVLVHKKGSTVPKTPSTSVAAPVPAKACLATKPFLGNYCWTHCHKVNQTHTSATCTCMVAGHKVDVTTANTMGGSKAYKGLNSRT
jgi:hypothetical protein